MSQQVPVPHTTLIGESVSIGNDSTVQAFCHIMDHVTIGDHCQIGNGVIIYPGTTIRDAVRIDDYAVIGKQPMRAVWSVVEETQEEIPPVLIGSGCLIGAHTTLYAGVRLADHVLIADGAAVREAVTIGEATIVGRSVTVEQQCTIGRQCKLETDVYITALSVLEDFCFIAPGVITTNDNYLGRTEERKQHFKGVTVRRGGRIGARSVILPGKEIGPDAVVAAGSVVTGDVPGGEIHLGAPAKFFRMVPEEQLLENQHWT